jgi:DNA-binding IscR family transcriptional regulator
MSTNSLFTSMVHVLALLASTDEPLSSSWIAQSVNTNPVVIRQVVGHLRDAGLVVTTPGCIGGARLARDAAQITLDDVYQLVRQDTFFGLHANEPNPHCPVGRNIQGVLIDVFGQMDELIADALSELSIAEIVARVQAHERDSQGCAP